MRSESQGWRWRRLSWGAMAALIWPAQASAQVPAQTQPQQVEVHASGDAQRRADLAGRQVVERQELLRHGDTGLAEALRRVPGVTVGGRGQASELQLGGLGGGYTQLLLNGVPVPRDFSLDSIALDSLERVEIVRGATVQSAQAIAGSINLVTRRATQLATRDLKLTAGSQWGRPQATAALNLGDRLGDTTWGLGLGASSERQLWPATVLQEQRSGPDGTLTQRTLTDKREFDHTDALSANPRLAWKHEDAQGASWQWSTDHSLRYAVSDGGVSDRRSALTGPPPAQQASDMALDYRRWFWRGRLQAQHREADGAQYEARLNLTTSRRDQHSHLLGTDFAPQLVQDEVVTGQATDRSVVLNLNHQRALGEAHRLDLGAELEQAQRIESRVQTDRALPAGLPPDNLDERYDARVQRRALYLQDDWSLAHHTEAQLGLRVEHLDTDSSGNVFTGVRQSHQLVGPVLRLSTTPEGALGTFKLGLSRGFKLPEPRDVMPRRYAPIEVSPTSPAFTGNPDLRPERAWSLDASWLRAQPGWQGESVLTAALRRIDDVILDHLITQPDDLRYPWLLQRFNGGGAWVANLELSLHGEARDLLLPGAPLRWQTSLSLNRSRLLDVAAEHPRLAGQPPWQFKLDLGQRLAPGWSANLGLNARGAVTADLPSGRSQAYNTQHSLSADLAWQPQAHQTWRLSTTQGWASDEVDTRTVQVVENGSPVLYRSRDAWHRQLLCRLSFESGF